LTVKAQARAPVLPILVIAELNDAYVLSACRPLPGAFPENPA
jgi:hypothetical protein